MPLVVLEGLLAARDKPSVSFQEECALRLFPVRSASFSPVGANPINARGPASQWKRTGAYYPRPTPERAALNLLGESAEWMPWNYRETIARLAAGEFFSSRLRHRGVESRTIWD
jgi:hypothetical protein